MLEPGRRKIAQLLSIGRSSSCTPTLGYYRLPELAGADPRHVLKLALGALADSSMPGPSVAISSSRGLYLLWLHSPIPRPALPRWTACQRELWEVLKLLDAARLLRVVGTVHGRVGAKVEP